MKKVVIVEQDEVINVFEGVDGVWDLVTDSEKATFPFEPDWADLRSVVRACEAQWPGAMVVVVLG